MNYWLLLEKSDDTRVSKGIEGYRDSTGEYYHYDSLVPNHRNVKSGDYVVLRKENEIIGIGRVGNITETDDVKIHSRCPQCESTDIRERSRKLPKWKCGQCATEFSSPKETITEIRSFNAMINDFTRLNAPPSFKSVKMCAANGKGESSQLSMLALDEGKVRTLFEGIDPSPSARGPEAGTSVQGFGLSQDERKAVELRAMKVARALYENQGWDVIDKSSSQPFDLLARKEGQERYIEVKGTTGDGDAVILTHGEVRHVRENPNSSSLVIVSGIVLRKQNEQWQALDGIITRHEDPWVLDDDCLNPTQYRYVVK